MGVGFALVAIHAVMRKRSMKSKANAFVDKLKGKSVVDSGVALAEDIVDDPVCDIWNWILTRQTLVDVEKSAGVRTRENYHRVAEDMKKKYNIKSNKE